MALSRRGLACWQHFGTWHLGWEPEVCLSVGAADIRTVADDVDAALARYPGAVAVGLISYESGLPLQAIPPSAVSGPGALVQVYSPDKTFAGSREECLQKCHELASGFRLTTPFVEDMNKRDYLIRFDRIRDYLESGDAYQVNFARCFHAGCEGDALAAWVGLIRRHPAPHACFMTTPDGAVFGVSPERFLKIAGRRVVTEPIKGSRPRLADPRADAAIADALLESAKDRAENLMIVDLMRNDLGKVCRTGSVQTTTLFDLRHFSNVHHLVSVIEGDLQDHVRPLEALVACFPGGSITGAPKRRAMEIICELETTPRGFYCGSQFSLDASGQLDSSILIRTFQQTGHELRCHGGGGIVVDSDGSTEFDESLFKVEALMNSLG